MAELRYCRDGGLLVGGRERVPTDLSDYGRAAGCNRIFCPNCREWIRIGPPGLRYRGEREIDRKALFETAAWADLPFMEKSSDVWRLYACRCSEWLAGDSHELVNDGESPGDPRLPWRCAGHEVPKLPVKIGDIFISDGTDWPNVVERILDGDCPQPLAERSEGPASWLTWLYGYLVGLTHAQKLSSALAARVDDERSQVVGRVLRFFVAYPTADGVDLIVSKAESSFNDLTTRYPIPEVHWVPSIWDVLVAIRKQRSDENDELDLRVVALLRRAFLQPVASLGAKDVVREMLSAELGSYTDAEAFDDDDLAFVAQHLVEIEAAGPGRWKSALRLLTYWANRKPELAALVVIAAIALIQKRAVDLKEMRTWLDAEYRSSEWVPPIRLALDEAST